MQSRLLPLLAVFVAGCGSDVVGEPEPTAPPEPVIGTAFDAAKSGRITGRVKWNGAIPEPPGFLYAIPQADGRTLDYRTAENPNRPMIDHRSHAVEGAVVFLREINPAVAKPWDLQPVRVEMGGGRIDVIQGERRGRVGFVRRGDPITVESIGPAYHVLRGRGDAFFSLPLPEARHPVSRKLHTPGRIELTSGTGHYWANADLFIADHPYFTLTDSTGGFEFDSVPTGAVEVVVWLPGWSVARQERDPDSTAIARMSYAPPIARTERVTVTTGGATEVGFSVP